jgi:transposase-like protein
MTESRLATAKDPEVREKATRRRFSAEYKLRILEEAAQCSVPGEVGSLLRREGLYSSHLVHWREQRAEGSLVALGRKRGRKPTRTGEQLENERLRREVERLERRLAESEKIIEVQKKLCAAINALHEVRS